MHGDETLDAEGAEGSVVSCGGDYEGGVDGVGVHAGLVIVVHGYEGPVCHYAGNSGKVVSHLCVGEGGDVPESSVVVLTGDEIFDRGSIEELDVREGENFREEGGSEECLNWISRCIFDLMAKGVLTACFTTTKSPSSSKGTPRSVKNASAGLRITMALKSWPPSQAPPPGETEASMMAIFRSGRALPSM